MNQTTTLKFRDLLRAAMEPKGLTQHDLAFHVNVSQTAISLVGSHKMDLSEKIAAGIAKVLGGDKEFWLSTYADFATGQAATLDPYLTQIGGGYTKGQTLGTGVRRLLNDEMIELFWNGGNRSDCLIRGFDPRRVRPSSYYTRLGYVDDGTVGPARPLRDPIEIRKNQTIRVRSLEAFHLPFWLEAQFHPASAMAENGLTVEHGPSIDPGFDKGCLRVTVRNIRNESVFWEPDWPFLKLHFLVFDRAAKTDYELGRLYDLGSVSSTDIYKAATEVVP